jgi:hypothetical protein
MTTKTAPEELPSAQVPPADYPMVKPTWPTSRVSSDKEQQKYCFVTVGATAPFNRLLFEILSKSFLSSLRKKGYTDVRVQYGDEGKLIFDEFITINEPDSEERSGLNITGFGFSSDGMTEEMLLAKADDGRSDGLIICHAGAHLLVFLPFSAADVIYRLWNNTGCSKNESYNYCRPK